MLAIYWEIGNTITVQENEKGWGAKVVEQLAQDLRSEFPDFKGLSLRNLRYMRAFAVAWPELAILQQPATTLDNSLILQQPVAKLPLTYTTKIRLVAWLLRSTLLRVILPVVIFNNPTKVFVY